MSIEKLDLTTPDFTDAAAARIAELFPNVVTEGRDEDGQPRRMIDFDLLKQELSDDIVEGPAERYHLNWPGKRAALREANRPIDKTLRPARAESVDFDTTRNLFIEGDNLDALKLLQETYLGKVKMIYIDPPYNTGKDFIYKDNFTGDKAEHLEASGQVDEDGGKLVANPESHGRYHSDWLSMMYPRLKLARNLLREDGVIFISISDHEIASLMKMAGQIFGEENFIGCVIWNSTKSVTNTALISVGHTYNLIYARSRNYFKVNRPHFRLAESGDGFENPDNDPRGPWKADPFQVGGWRPDQQYEVKNPTTGEIYKPNPGSSWKNGKAKFDELLRENRIVFGATGEAGPQRKRFLSEALDRGKVAKTWWDDVPTTTNGTSEVKSLFDDVSVFSNPKPTGLIERFIELGDQTQKAIILDFFAGSSSTAHALFKKNAEDGGKRQFIQAQIAEEIDPDDKDNESILNYLVSQSLEPTIAEISKERIRRAGAKILEENPDLKGKLDVGFRVLKIDSSNLKDVRRTAGETRQADLVDLVENIKPDRTGEDLLFQVMLNWGVDLTLPIARETLAGKAVYFVADDALAGYFAKPEEGGAVDEALIKALAARSPLRAVFRDDAFPDDAMRINAEQLFKQLSPRTELRVI